LDNNHKEIDVKQYIKNINEMKFIKGDKDLEQLSTVTFGESMKNIIDHDRRIVNDYMRESTL